MKKKYLTLLLSVTMAFSSLPAVTLNATPANTKLRTETGEILIEEVETTSLEETTESEVSTEEWHEETEEISEEPSTPAEEIPKSGETPTEEETEPETITSEESSTEMSEETTEDFTDIIEETTEEFSTVSEETTTEEMTVDLEEVTSNKDTLAETTSLKSDYIIEAYMDAHGNRIQTSGASSSIKAVGRNGILYDDVAYLSSTTVRRLPTTTQSVYTTMCDDISSWIENGMDVYDIVISVNKNGDLEMGASIPAQTIFTGADWANLIMSENENLMQSYSIVEEDISGVPYVELYSLLKNEDYFRSHLYDGFEQDLYDSGKTNIVKKGYNYIKVTGIREYNKEDDDSGKVDYWNDAVNAFDALIATYPNKFNWVNWGTGAFRKTVTYYNKSKTYSFKFSLEKSKYYSSTLEKKAEAKVKTLVSEANAYATEKYPESPAYGIIEYFNDWICENNYYEREHGTSTEKSVRAGKIYYYSHSCYGTLLYGYGVCESYALTMSRLLDAAGIRNIYVIGFAGTGSSKGGHAWNIVEMPDGQWYMIDSTWNDSLNTDSYLLGEMNDTHQSSGVRWTKPKNNDNREEEDQFRDLLYPVLSTEDYTPGISESEQTQTLVISNETVVLKPKQKYQLSLNDPNVATGNYYEKFAKTWSSDNTRVAKVDSTGKVTAGTIPGKATITVKAAGKEFTSTVYVYQFTNIKFDTNNKTSYTAAYCNPDSVFDEEDIQTVELNVNQKNYQIPAQAVVEGNNLNEVTAVSNRPYIAKVDSVTLEDDTITLNVLPQAVGSAKITINLAGKKAYYTITIRQDLQEEWFNYSNIVDTTYSGKNFKPSIPLTEAGRDCSPKATYKITYTNNKNAGEATITIKGTGKYSGTIIKNFTIFPKDMSAAVFRSCTTSRTYNAKPRAATTNVRLVKTTLKAGRDYTVLYNGSDIVPTESGTYEVTIVGKGNYIGELAASKTYIIKPNSIKNMTVSHRSSVKYSGEPVSVLRNVKISGNLLPEKGNYTISYLDSAGVESTEAPIEKGKYKLIITPVEGGNVTTTLTRKCIKKSFTIK